MHVTKRQFLAQSSLLGMGTLATSSPAAAAPAAGEPRPSGAPVLNVRDFGARGDGVTPDSASIQKALDAAGSISGTAYFPPGRYLCHDLKVRPHTSLLAEPQWGYRGDGGAMLLLDADDAACVLDVTGAFGAHLRGLFLRGRRAASKPIHGVFLNNSEKYSPQEDP